MFGRTCLLVWICFFQATDANNSFRRPTLAEDESVSKHIYSYDDTYTYQQAEHISFWCFPPPFAAKSIILRWNDVTVAKANPTNTSAFPDVTVNASSSPISLSLHYNPKQFVNIVNVSCEAYDPENETRTATRYMLVEQQYATSNVVITEGEDITADPDELVELNCVADGNPPPEYQWESKRGIKRMPMTHSTLYFYQPLGDVSMYKCKAKNNWNQKWIDSTWVEITGVPSVSVANTPSVTMSTLDLTTEKATVTSSNTQRVRVLTASSSRLWNRTIPNRPRKPFPKTRFLGKERAGELPEDAKSEVGGDAENKQPEDAGGEDPEAAETNVPEDSEGEAPEYEEMNQPRKHQPSTVKSTNSSGRIFPSSLLLLISIVISIFECHG